MTLPDLLAAEAARSFARKLTAPRPAGPELTAIALMDLPVIPPWCQDDESLMETVHGPLKIPLGMLRAFRISIICTGTEPLHAERFQHPIRVDFFDKAALTQLTIQWRRHHQLSPEDNAIRFDQESHAVLIHPPLMNPGDALILKGLAVADGPLEPTLSVRYPNLPTIEQLRLTAESAVVTFQNLDAGAQELRWTWLRKLSPKRWRYRRAAQLNDAIDILLHWQDSR